MNMASEDAPPCIIHQDNVANEEVKRFTPVRWDKWRESVNKWLVLDGHERRLAESARVYIECEKIPSHLGYHDTCYRRFIDAKRIRGAEKRCSQTMHDDSAIVDDCMYEPSPKKLRSASNIAGHVESSRRHVLPAVCLICNRADKYCRVQRKRVLDRLCQAETETAGM